MPDHHPVHQMFEEPCPMLDEMYHAELAQLKRTARSWRTPVIIAAVLTLATLVGIILGAS